MSNEPNKIIYSMIGVTRKIDKKAILKDIYLSYFYGAKIGVLGLNGAGKSTLLRILAGVDKDYEGQIHLQPGYTIGFLEQEPHLDESKTVRQNRRRRRRRHRRAPQGIRGTSPPSSPSPWTTPP